jgi:hypothetical protein
LVANPSKRDYLLWATVNVGIAVAVSLPDPVTISE